MCGRIDQSQPIEHYVREWPGVINTSQATPKFNVSPGTYRPILHCSEGKKRIEDLHWGYQAAWAVGKVPMAINTRLEKISGKYWKHLLTQGRAIVPADGWYEWTGENGAKQPSHVHRLKHEPLLMAALVNFGPGTENKATSGFTIVTADALGGMVDVHDRRPVVFSAADAALWLDPDLEADAAEEMARQKGLGPDSFEWYAVSKLVGNVKNEGPLLSQPITVEP